MNHLYFTYLIVSWCIVILIWLVQLVHYPSFKFIDPTLFIGFHNHHAQSITIIVMPLMLLELGLGFYLCFTSGFQWVLTLAFLMIVSLWLSTFLISVPLHHQLSAGKNLEIIQELISTNWIRTALWTLKAILLSWYLRVKMGM